MNTQKSTILFITRNSLLEPLGQSQVIPYFLGLAKNFSIIIISFEKFDRASVGNLFQDISDLLIKNKIVWYPQSYGLAKSNFSTFLTIVRMLFLIVKILNRKKIDLLHARSYIPAISMLIINKITNIPFVFDMRGFWPEELVSSHRISRNSFIYKLLVMFERFCIQSSSATVVLSNAAKEYIVQNSISSKYQDKIYVIPTCVDVGKFQLINNTRFSKHNFSAVSETVYGCIGTLLSGWFLTDWLSQILSLISKTDALARFEIVTIEDPDLVRSKVDPECFLGGRLEIYSASPKDMPNILLKHDASFMFYGGSKLSEIGRCPTRFAEVLSSGRPVVINAGVGDTAEIVKKYRVGVILDNIDESSINRALNELRDLFLDPNLDARCRAAAETIFSLNNGVESYTKIYNAVLNF